MLLALALALLASDPTSGSDLTLLDAQGGPLHGRAGTSMDADVDYVVLGAPGAGSLAANDGAGLVYVYRRTAPAGPFELEAKLYPSQGLPEDLFGISVAIDAAEGWILVGASGDDEGIAGSGAVYVFRRTAPGVWTEHAKVKAPTPFLNEGFGWSVDIEAVASTEVHFVVGGPQSTQQGHQQAGVVHFYQWDGTSIVHEFGLLALSPGTQEYFGYSVALGANSDALWAFLGAPGDDTPTLNDTGSVLVYVRLDDNWVPVHLALPNPPQAQMFFGWSLDLVEDRLIVGAPGDVGAGAGFGAAFVLAPSTSGNGWSLEQRLPGTARGSFGRSVAMDLAGGTYRALVGGPLADSAFQAELVGGAWTTTASFGPSDGATAIDFGASVALAGGDAWVGAPRDGDAAPEAGAAYGFDALTSAWTGTKLRPVNAGAFDRFGSSLAVAGDVLVTTAPGSDLAGENSGGAFVWERSGTNWTSVANLNAELDAHPYALFGTDVAAYGSTVAVSAVLENTPAPEAGAVYLYRDGPWHLEERFERDNAFEGFGASIALSFDMLVVGAPGNPVGGIVYTYRYTGSSNWPAWVPALAPDGASGDGFGAAVGYQDDGTLVVGAPGDDDGGLDAGAAYVFQRGAGPWIFRQKLVGPAPGDGDAYGSAVALQGDRLVVGAPLADAYGTNTGTAYVYRRNGVSWTLEGELVPQGLTASAQFGTDVALDAGAALVGGPFDGGAATNGGAAQLFRWTGTAWSFAGDLVAPGTTTEHGRGSAVALLGSSAFVGAPGADAALPGAGRIELFEMPDAPLFYCTGKTSSLGCVPFISATGTPSVTDSRPFTLGAHDLLPSEPGFLLYGYAKANLGFHGGKLCVKAPVRRLLPPKAAQNLGTPPCTGVLQRNFNNRIQGGADPLLTVGQRVFAQWRTRDPADPAGFGDGLTNAVRFTVCP